MESEVEEVMDYQIAAHIAAHDTAKQTKSKTNQNQSTKSQQDLLVTDIGPDP